MILKLLYSALLMLPSTTNAVTGNEITGDNVAREQGGIQTFGQFVGSWSFTLKNHLPAGTIAEKVGTWDFQMALEGRAVQDFWTVPGKGQPSEALGTTVRVYDQKTDTWQVAWIGGISATVEVFEARQIGKEIVLLSRHGSSQDRWTFFHIENNHFDWRAESSKDGTTWSLEQEMSVTRVQPK